MQHSSLFSLVHFVFLLLTIGGPTTASAQSTNTNNAYPSVSEMIVGQWKAYDIHMRVPESKTLTKQFNEPFAKAFMLRAVRLTRQEYRANGKYMVNDQVVDTYKVSNDSITIGVNKTDKNQNRNNEQDELAMNPFYRGPIEPDKYKIVLVNADTLILSRAVRLSDPMFSMVRMISQMNQETALDFENSTLEVTTTYLRMKTEKAPWKEISAGVEPYVLKRNKSRVMSSENLLSLDSTYICYLRQKNKNKQHYAEMHYRLNEEEKPYNRHNFAAELYYRRINEKKWSKQQLIFDDPKEMVKSLSISGKFLTLETNQNIYFASEPSYKFLPFNLLDESARNALSSGNSAMSAKWLAIPIEQRNFEHGDIQDTVMMAVKQGRSKDGTSIYYTTQNAPEWGVSTIDNKQFPGLMPLALKIFDRAAILVTQYGNFISKDLGKTWELDPSSSINVPITLGSERANCSFTKYANYWFAACISGVLISADGGLTWIELSNSQLCRGVSSVAIMGDAVYALGEDDRIWKASLEDLLQFANITK
jgi:hypothetical protein